MAARSGVRRQQARQLLNTTRRWQGSKTWRERENQKIWRVRLAPRPSVRTKAFFHRVTVKAVAPLHAPACEDSQPGSNFSTQHGAGRVERRQVPKCRWLHALACEHSQPGNSFQEEWTIQPAAQEETDKDPKARLAPRSGVRAKPAWQMDPEGRDGCTLRRAKTASQATTSQHNTALAGFKNVERDNKKTWRVRLAPRPSVPTKALFHRVTVKAVAPCSGVRRQPARQ